MPAAIAILVALIATTALAAEPATLTGKVVSVHDGDTLRVVDGTGGNHAVRLQGIDAPETSQPFGTKSRNRLATLAMGKRATVAVHDTDQYGRLLGTVEVAGKSVNATMVADGMAWHYSRYSKDATLAAAEAQARKAKRGLWADAHPVAPWEWRATERDRKGQPAGR